MQIEGAHMIRLVEQPAPEVTIVDVLVGSLGIAGVMTLTAVVLGAVLGWLLVRRSRRRGLEQEHPPSIQPFQ